MTQPLAYWIGGLLLLALSIDVALHGSTHLVFAGQLHLSALHWLAFWR